MSEKMSDPEVKSAINLLKSKGVTFDQIKQAYLVLSAEHRIK